MLLCFDVWTNLGSFIYRSRGSGFCFWHLVRGSWRSGRDAGAALRQVINTGHIKRQRGCTAAESCDAPALGPGWSAHWLHGKFTHGAGNSQQKGHYNHTQLHAFPCWSLAKWPPCCGHVLTSMSLQPWAQLLVFWMEVSRWGFSIIFPPPFTCIPFIPSYCSSPHLKGSTDLPWRMTSGLKQPLSWQSAFGRARHPQLKQRETKASKLEDVTNAAQSTADPRRYQI